MKESKRRELMVSVVEKLKRAVNIGRECSLTKDETNAILGYLTAMSQSIVETNAKIEQINKGSKRG